MAGRGQNFKVKYLNSSELAHVTFQETVALLQGNYITSTTHLNRHSNCLLHHG